MVRISCLLNFAFGFVLLWFDLGYYPARSLGVTHLLEKV